MREVCEKNARKIEISKISNFQMFRIQKGFRKRTEKKVRSPNRILSPTRLPIPPQRRIHWKALLLYMIWQKKASIFSLICKFF